MSDCPRDDTPVCPVCGLSAERVCRCPIRNCICELGHHWHYEDGAAVLGESCCVFNLAEAGALSAAINWVESPLAYHITYDGTQYDRVDAGTIVSLDKGKTYLPANTTRKPS